MIKSLEHAQGMARKRISKGSDNADIWFDKRSKGYAVTSAVCGDSAPKRAVHVERVSK